MAGAAEVESQSKGGEFRTRGTAWLRRFVEYLGQASTRPTFSESLRGQYLITDGDWLPQPERRLSPSQVSAAIDGVLQWGEANYQAAMADLAQTRVPTEDSARDPGRE